MKCSNCGKDIPSTAKFCPGCGSAIVPEDDVNINITEVQEPCLDRVDNPMEIMSVSSEIQNGKPGGNEKQPFVWKDQHTYIAIGVGLILAVIIGFAIRTSKNNSMNDNYVATSQENDYENGYENTNADLDTNNTQEDSYNKSDDESEVSKKTVSQNERVNNVCTDTERVFDYADVLSDEEEELLRELIAQREKQTRCDIVLVTMNESLEQYAKQYSSSSYGDEWAMIMADNFWDEYGFGWNKYVESNDGDGVLLLDNWYRESDGRIHTWFLTSGRAMSCYAESMINHLLDEVYKYVEDDPYKAYETYVETFYYDMTSDNYERVEDLGQEDYILCGSNSRYLNISELNGLSAEECRLARNELYARHGRKFDDEGLRAYFESKEWYIGTIEPSDFTEDMLNDYEIYNRDMIVKYEKEQGYR